MRAAAATSASSGTSPGGGSRSARCASMNPVSVSPARYAGMAPPAARGRRGWCERPGSRCARGRRACAAPPPRGCRPSRRACRSSSRRRRSPCRLRARRCPGARRAPRAACAARRCGRSRAGSRCAGFSAQRRTSIACPPVRISSCLSGSSSPAATRSCHSTRSSPVIISVTGCSTCRRVFISMKKNWRSAPTMNSTVPAPR